VKKLTGLFMTAIMVLFIGTGCEDKTPKVQTVDIGKKVEENIKEDVVQKVDKKEEEIAKHIKKAEKEKVVESEADGWFLYLSNCKSCHGERGQKKALGASRLIGGWEAIRTEAALNGFKEGTYGGKMKATMESRVKKLSTAEIKALAKYIATLKP
jgi:cytochrome c553